MGMWMDPPGQNAKQGCQDSDDDSRNPAEDEGATTEVVRTHPQKTTESPHEVGIRFGGTREASERSPEEMVKGRHQERSRRGGRCARRRP
ncbi:unnamed protein product [Heligmosomoides polygyrus]|uniref:Uncharacterized protein n=1 Tax=Heligmosomoides polygyrus TaxID=6339 RepID=A0A183GSW5_HELPZ|nr:unnamed protein product [Heligmosomoides polygyrus]